MNKLVLIDSSVWISFYRPKESPAIKDKVINLIKEDLIATCGLIKAELLQGTTDQKSFDIVSKDLSAFHQVKTTESVFDSAAKLAFDLRRKGVTAPMIDIVISTLAIKNDLTLLHMDNHYELIKETAKITTESLL